MALGKQLQHRREKIMVATTKNIEKYYLHRTAITLADLAAISTTGIVNGLIMEVSDAGIFQFQTPITSTPDGRDVILAADGGGVWLRQTLAAMTTTSDGRIAIFDLQVEQTPILLTANTSINGGSLNIDTPYIYESTAAGIITLTITGGYTIRNPVVLNGTANTIGFNPTDSFTLTAYSDMTILIT